ncbi:MAG TPA: DUF1016 domain-containing protein, partial [Deltaproteobacteria bacterium]|nr:DUF1016 domain-containing protein [Deltaproteobacteria bacterium]
MATLKKIQNYDRFAGGIRTLLTEARKQAARSVNAIMTATYWEIGRRIVEFEQHGKGRAAYGEQLIERLAKDLTKRFGRGFGASQIKMIRQFYLFYPHPGIRQSLTGEFKKSKKRRSLTSLFPSKGLEVGALAQAFPLSWTHYARLLRVVTPEARAFYEKEALRGG